MAIFEIYTKEIEIKGEKYKIRPLSGRYLPQLYSIISKFAKEGDNINISAIMGDKDVVASLYELALETMKKSYPSQDPVVLDEFVSQNLIKFMQVLIEVNLSKD